MSKIIKEIEYEEAPSGYVNFYNYKEPLQKYEAGFGYWGALIFDGKTDRVQCHLCGEWLEALNSSHLKLRHGINAAEYKVTVGLNPGTALISESYREKLIAAKLGVHKNLKNRKGIKHSEETKEKIRQALKANRSELQNLNGTCPLQLIDRMKKLADKLGRTPTHAECTFHETAVKCYGDWKSFIKKCGLTPRKSGHNIKHWTGRRTEYTKESLIQELVSFKKRYGRNPSESDFRRGILASESTFVRHFGSVKKARLEAYGDKVTA